MPSNKYTRFSFTCLRPNDSKIAMLDKIPNLELCFYSLELGPVSKLPHLQGYLEVSVPIEVFKLKSYLKPFYVESARESRHVNYLYCTKESSVTIYNPKGLDIK